MHALHGIVIRFALLVEFFDDLLSFGNCVRFDVKLSTEFSQMGLQFEILFLFSIKLFEKVLLH